MRLLPRFVMTALFLGSFLAAPGQVPSVPTSSDEAPAAQATDPVPDPDVPQPIAAKNVPARAEATDASLQETAPQLARSPDVQSIEERVSELSETAGDYRDENVVLLEAGELSFREMEETRRQVGRFRNQIEDWQEQLASRSQELNEIKDRLARSVEIWQLTLDEAESDEEEFPEALVERTRSVLGSLQDSTAIARERLDHVLTLQNRLSEAMVALNAFESRIDTAGEEFRHGLWYRDSPPLWAPESETWSGVGLAKQLQSAEEEIRRVVAEWWQDYRDRVGYHLAFLVVLLFVLVVLGRRLRSWDDVDPSLAAARTMLAHPLAASLILFLIASFWFYDRVPRLVDEIILVLLLVPVLRVVHGLIHPDVRRPISLLAVLYILHFLTRAAPDGSPLQRVALLIVGVGGLAGIAWILSRRRTVAADRPSTRVRVAAQMLRIAAIPLAVAVVANVVGIVALARILTGGTVASSWLAVILYAAQLMLSSVVAILLRTPPLNRLAGIRRHRELVQHRVNRVLQILATYLWIEGSLFVFGILDQTKAFAVSLLTDPLPFPGEIKFSLGGVLAFFLTLWGASLLSRFIRFVLDEDVLPRLPLPRGVPAAVSKGLHYLIMTAGFLLAVMATGIDTNRFTLLAGAFGVGLGFGMQNIVNNFVSGLILLFERPVQIGDTVQIGTLIGKVREIGIRSSTVRTFEGAEVIVPNGILIADQVVNWTLSDRQRRIEIPVGVSYGSDPHAVIEILLDAARKHPQAMTAPSPVALFEGFGESSMDFILRFWTTNFDDWVTIRSEAVLAIHDALHDAGIKIPFPQRELHLKDEDAERLLGDARDAPPVSGTNEHDGS